MRVISTFFADFITNALGIALLLAISQGLRLITDTPYLPEIIGDAALGLIGLCAAVKTLFELEVPLTLPWDRY